MTDQDLRSKLVRLAHEKPELRPHLLPLLKEGSEGKTATMTTALALPIKEAATLLVQGLAGGNFPAEAEASFQVVLQTCVMFARRGVRDTVLTALLMKAEDRLSKMIIERQSWVSGDDF